MGDEKTVPRRYAMASEMTDDEREAASVPGASGKVERAEYVRWRREQIKTEREDLALRARLLGEESETLRTRAGGRKMRALESLTVPQHMERQALERAAKYGDGPALPVDEKVASWEAQAAELDAEADEIAQHLAEHAPVATPEEHLERIRGNR